MVSDSSFYQNCHIAAGCNWNGDLRNIQSQYPGCSMGTREPVNVGECLLVHALQFDDQPEILVIFYCAVSIHGANVDNAQAPDLKKVLQQRRASSLNNIRCNA